MMTKRYAICVRVDDEYADAAPTCRLREAIAVTMRAHHVPPDAGATLLITGDDEIRKLNRRFRGVDSPTDVLSFPAADDPDDVLSSTEPEPYLGDIIVAFPYTAAYAEQDGHALEDVLILLAVHGTLHLLGFDHDNAKHQAEMWAAQEAILTLLKVPVNVIPPQYDYSE